MMVFVGTVAVGDVLFIGKNVSLRMYGYSMPSAYARCAALLRRTIQRPFSSSTSGTLPFFFFKYSHIHRLYSSETFLEKKNSVVYTLHAESSFNFTS